MGLIALLAALMVSLGCDLYQLQSYSGLQYPAPPFPTRLYPPWNYQDPRDLASGPPISRGTVHLGVVEECIWRFTNEVRRKYGFSPLDKEGRLSAGAEAYCDDMLRRRFFSHTNPEGLTAGDRITSFYSGPIYGLGENIWMGSNLSPGNNEALARFIMDSWMSSSGHRQNVISPEFTHLGVGVTAMGGEIRASQLFAKLQHN
jgi:hypothetical protein